MGNDHMPVRVGWYIKNRILMIQIKGIVTDQEYLDLGNSPVVLGAMDRSPASRIHYFFEIVDPKTKLPSIRVRGRTLIERHPKDGWSMLIHFTTNPLWKMTATIIAQISRGRFLFVDSCEAALNFMQRIDASLPSQPDATLEWFYEVNWTTSSSMQNVLPTD
jgi:hypothetical protein